MTINWKFVAVLTLLGGPPRAALALQPLAAFLAGARAHNPQITTAAANVATAEATALLSVARVLPSVSLRAGYIRNQYAVALQLPGAPQKIVIQPSNQLTGAATLTVPLIDLAGFVRIAAGHAATHGGEAARAATLLQVESQVTQAYYQLVAQAALVASAQHARDTASANLVITQQKFDAGAAAVLELDRAKADLERQVQVLADADLQAALAARSLESLTLLTPQAEAMGSAPAELVDDLHEEAPPEVDDGALPAVNAAGLATLVARRNALAQRLALVPTLSGNFTENFTNAASFVGHDRYYAAGLTLNWTLDAVVFGNIASADATRLATEAQQMQARLTAHDSIHQYSRTIGAAIARARSAREQARVSTEAAALAQERYAAGSTTQIDLLTAQRDAFTADAGRIQAEADLVNARAQLRFAAGIAHAP